MYLSLGLDELRNDFESYVEALTDTTPPPPPYVPQTVFWGVVGHHYVGRIALRHALSERLLVEGGNIGYDVRPSERRKGYATAMLRQVLEEARSLGLERVLITCDEDNIASARTAESAGGVLEKIAKVADRPGTIRYYWIAL